MAAADQGGGPFGGDWTDPASSRLLCGHSTARKQRARKAGLGALRKRPAACGDRFLLEALARISQCAMERRLLLTGAKTRPTTVAPVGSSQGGSWRQRYGLKPLGDKGPLRAAQRTCGPETRVNVEQAFETGDAGADPPEKWGRPEPEGEASDAGTPLGPAGVVTLARMEEEEGGNMGSPAGGEAHTEPAARGE